MVRHKTLAEQIAELEIPTQKEQDPEDFDLGANYGESGSSDEDGAEKPYDKPIESSRRSNLRSKNDIILGPSYASSTITRKQLEEDSDGLSGSFNSGSGGSELEYDALEDRDSDVSDSSPKFANAGAKTLRNGMSRPTSRNYASDEDGEPSSSAEADSYISSLNSDEEMQSLSENEQSDSSLSSGSSIASTGPGIQTTRSGRTKESSLENGAPTPSSALIAQGDKVRALMLSNETQVASTLAQSLAADAAKGKAIRSQRATFDSLLNSRIHLQKSLIAVNSLETVSNDNSGSEDISLENAESTLISLWTAIDDLRLGSATTNPKKRKRSFDPSASSPLDQMWDHMVGHEEESKKSRHQVLDKWSSRLQPVSLKQASHNSRHQQAAKRQKLLSSVLPANIATSRTKLITRTQLPQACAPVQASRLKSKSAKSAPKSSGLENGTQNDVHESDEEEGGHIIYDDTSFYQYLLRELIEQRSGSSVAASGNRELSAVDLAPTAKAQLKSRKFVDTKASKGRKMKYTVHEKLQNFMAREDRTTWSTELRNSVFSNLFGKRAEAVLDENDKQDEDTKAEAEAMGYWRSAYNL